MIIKYKKDFNYNDKFNELYLKIINETNKRIKDDEIVSLIDLFINGPSVIIKRWFEIESYMNYDCEDIKQVIAEKIIVLLNKNIINLGCYKNAYNYFVTVVNNAILDFTKTTMPLKNVKASDKVKVYSYEYCSEESDRIVKFTPIANNNVSEIEKFENKEMKTIISVVEEIPDGSLYIENIIGKVSLEKIAKREHTTVSKIRTRFEKVKLQVIKLHPEYIYYLIA